MVGVDCFPANAVAAASMTTAILNFIFITFLSLPTRLWNLSLTYITGAPGATVSFTDRLAVRAEVLLRFRAPVNAAGILVLRLAVIIHFLATHVAAGNLNFLRRLGSIHNFYGALCLNLPWIRSLNFRGSFVPMRKVFPSFMHNSTASNPEMLNSHVFFPIQWMPQPCHQRFRTGPHDSISVKRHFFRMIPGPNRTSINSSSSSTVKRQNKTAASSKTVSGTSGPGWCDR